MVMLQPSAFPKGQSFKEEKELQVHPQTNLAKGGGGFLWVLWRGGDLRQKPAILPKLSSF